MTPVEIGLVLLSALLHAGWSVAIKSSRDPIGFNLIQVWFAPLVALALWPWLPVAEIPREIWWWVGISGVAHALYFYWLGCALERGDLSLVYPIARSAPALIPLVAVPLLGERLSVGGAAGIAVVVVGMWAVQGVGGWNRAALRDPGIRFALLTLAGSVLYSLTDKQGMAKLAALPWESPIPRALAFYLWIHLPLAVVFTALVLRVRSREALRALGWREVGRGFAASTVSMLGYGLILAALATAPVSYVVAVRQTSVLFAVALGVVWLRERPDRVRLAGAAATVLGVALIARFS